MEGFTQPGSSAVLAPWHVVSSPIGSVSLPMGGGMAGPSGHKCQEQAAPETPGLPCERHSPLALSWYSQSGVGFPAPSVGPGCFHLCLCVRITNPSPAEPVAPFITPQDAPCQGRDILERRAGCSGLQPGPSPPAPKAQEDSKSLQTMPGGRAPLTAARAVALRARWEQSVRAAAARQLSEMARPW